MKLSTFIEEIGDEVAAELFKVKVRTVASWRRKERIPRPRQAQVIIAASEGKVDMHGIYGDDNGPNPSSTLVVEQVSV